MNLDASQVWKPGILVSLVSALLAAWFLSQLILGAGTSQLLLTVLAAGFGVILLLTLRNWRAGVWLLFAWLLFEDLARKYLGNNMIIYFGKDVLAGVTYLSFYSAHRHGEAARLRPPFWIPLLIFFWWSLLEVFNPNSPSLLYGGLAMKIYFYYVPLFFVGYAIFRNEEELRRFLLFNLGVAGVIAALGLIQAIIGPSFLNPLQLAPDIRELGTMTRGAVSGQRFYRPNSVFVSDGRFGAYLLLGWLLGVGVTAYWFVRRPPGKRYVLLFLGLITGAMVLCGVRGPLVIATASLFFLGAAFLWGLPWQRVGGRRVAKIFAATLLVMMFAVVCLMVLYPEAVAARWAFYEETLSPLSARSELASRGWGYPVQEFLKAFQYPNWAFGYGTGTCSLGGQYLTRILHVPPSNIRVESGYGALVLEMGVPGLVLWLIWTTALLVSASRVVKRLRGTALFPIGFVIALVSFLVLFAFPAMSNVGYQNFVLNAYLWLLLGILFRLPTVTAANSAARVLTPSRAP